jgi:hypothetical protein
MSWNTGFARIGAVFYVLWGLAHYNAAYGVYRFAQSTPLTIEHGRLEQLAFYLASFATAGIVFGTTLNWRNNRFGFWCNAVTRPFPAASMPLIPISRACCSESAFRFSMIAEITEPSSSMSCS